MKDVGALLDWIAAQPGLDKGRVMVPGGSYGGYMTLAAMTNYNDRFRCAVDVVGISNWVTFLENTESYRRDLRRVEYGDERDPKMREFLLSISPLTNAAKITKPMFIVQGRNDPRVPWTEAEQMVNGDQEERGAGLVPDGEGRGTRLLEEAEPGLPVLRAAEVRRGVPRQVRRSRAASLLAAALAVLSAAFAADPPDVWALVNARVVTARERRSRRGRS